MNKLALDKYYVGIVTYRMVGLHGLKDYMFSGDEVEDIIEEFRSNGEVVIIQTCNRVEVYTFNIDPLEVFRLKKGIGGNIGNIRILRGFQAIEHLVKVVTGLDSLALGEEQVLGQVRSQYNYFRDVGLAGRELEKIFSIAFRIGRRIRARFRFTPYDYARATIDIINRGQYRSILIIGTGEMARDILREMEKYRDRWSIHVAGRNGKSGRLKVLYPFIKPLELGDALGMLGSFDVVVTCVSSSKHIISGELIDRLKPGSLVIDLGVPSNVAPSSRGDIDIYDIDRVSREIREYYSNKGSEIDEVMAQVESELELLRRSIEASNVEDLIRRMYIYADRVRLRELEEAIHELEKMGLDKVVEDRVKRILESFSWSLIKKLYHRQVSRFRRMASEEGIDGELLSIISEIIGVDDGEA